MNQDAILQFTLVMVRVAGMVTFWPVFRRGLVPHSVRVGMVVALTFACTTAPQTAFSDLEQAMYSTAAGIVFGLSRELLFGAGVGFLLGLVIEPARIAGAYIGQEMGLTLANVADPDLGPANSIFTQIFELVAVLVFLTLNGHHLLLHALRASLSAIPVGGELFPLPFQAIPHLVDQMQQWGLLVAAPVAICLFLSLITLSLLARSVPQLNVFSVGFAFRIAVGLVSLVIFSPATLGVMAHVLKHAEGMLVFLK